MDSTTDSTRPTAATARVTRPRRPIRRPRTQRALTLVGLLRAPGSRELLRPAV